MAHVEILIFDSNGNRHGAPRKYKNAPIPVVGQEISVAGIICVVARVVLEYDKKRSIAKVTASADLRSTGWTLYPPTA
jgi:hypothetical protein